MTWETHLELDSDRNRASRFQGYVGEGLAAFGQVVILWNDPQGRRASALFDRFAQGLQAAGTLPSKTDEAYRALVASAARGAVEADPELMESRKGHFTFVAAIQQAGGLGVYALGPYFVFHIAEGDFREVVTPQSAASELVEKGTPRDKALEVAGTTTTKAVIPGGEDCEPYIRSAKVDLAPGEWLLVTPETKGLLGLGLERQPESLDDIRSAIEVLAGPSANFNRSWLTIHS